MGGTLPLWPLYASSAYAETREKFSMKMNAERYIAEHGAAFEVYLTAVMRLTIPVVQAKQTA